MKQNFKQQFTFLITSLISILSFSICAQTESQADSSSVVQKQLGLGATSMSYTIGVNGVEYDTLIGDVKITQDSFFLYCDTAYVQNKTEVQAFGNVAIQHGDSIEIFSDSMSYNDIIKKTELFGRVVFKKGNKRLNTELAIYNIDKKMTYYTKGATLINANQRLLSKKGIYDIANDIALFQGNVSVKDSSSLMQTDSLKYDLSNEIIYLIAPTNILTDSTEIYCERGFYNYKTQQGEFYRNLEILTGTKEILAAKVHYSDQSKVYTLTGDPVVNDKDTQAKADTIIFFEQDDVVDLRGNAVYKNDERELTSSYIKYNMTTDEYETTGGSEVVDEAGRILKAELLYRDKQGKDIAQSNVVLTDENEKVSLYSEILKSNNETGSYRAYNTTDSQPLLIKQLNDGNLLLKSDTLSYFKQDSSEYYRGEGNTSFLNKEISGKSGHLLYSVADSNYVFFDQPIIWSDSIQITGDTIIVVLKDGEINSLHVQGNAFMILQGMNGTYDQVKGDQLTCFFKGNNIQEIVVDDNVEMVYFMYEGNDLTGVNHSFCGGLVFTFVEKEMNVLRFKDKPNSKFTKGGIQNPETYNLQGFAWSIETKPNKLSFKR